MLLKSVSRVALFLLGSVPFSAGAAHANEHVIIVLGSAFFAYNTDVEPGDTVRFVNVSGTTMRLEHADGNWVADPLKEGQEMVLQVNKDTTGKYYGWTTRRIVGHLKLSDSNLTN